MRVLIVGSGAREHALVWKLLTSPRVEMAYCAPGNAGTAALAHNIPIAPENVAQVEAWVASNSPDLVVVGPEAPLAAGLVDRLEAMGVRAFGPRSDAARIEASKIWAKEFMLRRGIPTARAFPAEGLEEARRLLDRFTFPVVIKADGLAAGKGVTVVKDRPTAEEVLEDYLVRDRLGEAGKRLLVEEYLEGRELSVLAFTDGERVAVMPPARDYKRLGDGDTGPNTGGMGAYAWPSYATREVLEEVTNQILLPAVHGMAEEGAVFRGVLYAGLMITASGPKVLEFNCRFGDPETQAILPLLESDLVDITEACIDGRLEPDAVRWSNKSCCTVVLASAGYPGSYRTGLPIDGLDEAAQEDVYVFHAGTRLDTGSGGAWSTIKRELFGSGEGRLLEMGATRAPTLLTAGGRVLSVTAVAPTLSQARARAYAAAERIRFEGRYFRRDIAADEPLVNASATSATVEGAAAREPESEVSGRPSGSSERAAPNSGPGQARERHPQESTAPSPPGGTPGGTLPDPEQEAGRDVRKNPLVAVVMGSESDRPVMQAAAAVLESLGIPHEVLVMSAHRTPDLVREFALEAEAKGIRAIIAGAGGAAHLPGVIASWTTLPVIGVPLPGSQLRGVDALLSIVQMPAGVPVATVGIGESGAKNAAYLAAAILAASDEEVHRRYVGFRQAQRHAGRQ